MRIVNHVRSARPVAGLVLVGTVAAGCTSTDHTGAPVAQPPTVLTVATRTLGGGATLEFARRLTESSANHLRPEVKASSHRELGSDSDDAILADVVAGTSDVGEVSVAALERAGAHSLSPLTVPGLVTSIDAQQRLASGSWGAQALTVLSAARVRGIAILPGPVHRLATPGSSTAPVASLRDSTFELTADSIAARGLIGALGATLVVDDRADVLEPVSTAIDLSATTVSTRAVAGTGTLYADLPLWPDPTVLVMNPRVYDGLSKRDQRAVDEAARRSVADVARQRVRTEAESLAVMCALGWRVLPAESALVEAVRSQADGVARKVAEDPAIGGSLTSLREALGDRDTGPVPSCPTGTGHSVGTDSLPAELVGTWEAVATREDIDSHEPGVTEEGLVGPWTLVIGDGRVIVTDPQGGTFGGVLAVSGDFVIVVIDQGTIDQGLGERWRYHWSVLHDRLSLVAEPKEEMQKGPTSLVSQPFTRTS